MTNEKSFSEQLTPENTALLLGDHQVGTMTFGILDFDPVTLKNNTLWWAEAAKVFKLPAILTTSNPDGANGPLFDKLLATLPDTPIIDRLHINAWNDTPFVKWVESTGRKKLTIADVTADAYLTFPAVSAAREAMICMQ